MRRSSAPLGLVGRGNGKEAIMKELHVLFDGPPGHESGRFVECEDENGLAHDVGHWEEDDAGLWHLVIKLPVEEN